MNKAFLTIIAIAFSISSFAEKPVLKFNNGNFKVVQFTDLHWRFDEAFKQGNDSAMAVMKYVLNTEKPDLVIITGDIVVSKNVKKAYDQLLQLFTETKIPFAVTFGNHDTETDLTKQEILKIIQENPYNLTYNDDNNIEGVGNCYLPIKSSDEKINKWCLYLFDSHAYSKDTVFKGYDWIKGSQIDWYKRKSRELNSKNKVNAIAFFHIALPEFEEVRNFPKTIGMKNEKTYIPKMNSGLFNAFYEMVDVFAVFVGHNHNNDFIGKKGKIILGFGRRTGYNNAWEEHFVRGARVINLFENDRKINTYIRTIEKKEFEVNSDEL